MSNKRLDLKIGNYAKVQKGVLEPENAEYNIEDWQGKIIGKATSIEDEPLFLIKWDSVTLKNMPEAFIIESIQEDLEFGEMYLEINELTNTKPRDEEQDAEQVLKEINKKYDYIQPIVRDSSDNELAKQEQRISEILKGINVKNESEVEEKWEEYLYNNLKFPFEVVVVDRNEDTEMLDNGDIVNVKKIEGTFDLYGIIVEIRKGRRKYQISLCELEVTDKYSDNYLKVDDYNMWFENR